MNKKGLAIVNAYMVWPPITSFAKRMKDELNKLGIELDVISNSKILSYVSETGDIKGPNLKADFILFLDKDLYTSSMLEERGYRLYNSARSIALCDDKMLTYLTLANNGLRLPKTFSGPLDYAKEDNEDFISNLEKELPYPFIAKTNFGSQGSGVYLVKSHQDLVDFEKEHSHSPRLYQEFIKASKGIDYRLIVIGGKFFTGMRRENTQGDFRSNIALGGIGEKTIINPSFIEMAEKAASILNLDYCGVDLLVGPKGEPIICEVNSNAFIDGIEKATGANVAKRYAELIQQEVYGKD
jgi:gamma-F420-2:alpha-L-glutamate ligase